MLNLDCLEGLVFKKSSFCISSYSIVFMKCSRKELVKKLGIKKIPERDLIINW